MCTHQSGIQQLRARLRSLLKVRSLQAEVASLLPSADERKRLSAALHQPFEAYFASMSAAAAGGNPLLMLGAAYEDAWQVMEQGSMVSIGC